MTPLISQLYTHAVLPALAIYPTWDSPAARALVIGTFAHESMGGAYIAQWPTGPGMGFGQMEPPTVADTRQRVHGDILMALDRLLPPGADPYVSLATDSKYAAAMTRAKYRLWPAALPDAEDIEGLSEYWKIAYNSSLGAGIPAVWAVNYRRYVGALPA